jgi:hypothetical protein
MKIAFPSLEGFAYINVDHGAPPSLTTGRKPKGLFAFATYSPLSPVFDNEDEKTQMTMTRDLRTRPCADPTCRDGHCDGHNIRLVWTETADMVALWRDGERLLTLPDWELTGVCKLWFEMSGAADSNRPG